MILPDTRDSATQNAVCLENSRLARICRERRDAVPNPPVSDFLKRCLQELTINNTIPPPTHYFILLPASPRNPWCSVPYDPFFVRHSFVPCFFSSVPTAKSIESGDCMRPQGAGSQHGASYQVHRAGPGLSHAPWLTRYK